MDAREWSASADPTAMLNHLGDQVSDRKLRLFAVACCREIWDLLPDERSRAAVEVTERYADGQANERERAFARADALGAVERRGVRAAWASYWTASRNVLESIENASAAAAEASARAAALAVNDSAAARAAAWEVARAAGVQFQAALLREVVGNPFRHAALHPGWLRWNSGLIPSMAREMYDRRDFRDMAVLGDALEEAGCDDAAILDHCRRSGDHVRGCWVLDLLLGRA